MLTPVTHLTLKCVAIEQQARCKVTKQTVCFEKLIQISPDMDALNEERGGYSFERAQIA